MLTGAGGRGMELPEFIPGAAQVSLPSFPRDCPTPGVCLTLDYLDPKAVTMSNFVNVDFLVNCGKEAAYLF